MKETVKSSSTISLITTGTIPWYKSNLCKYQQKEKHKEKTFHATNWHELVTVALLAYKTSPQINWNLFS